MDSPKLQSIFAGPKFITNFDENDNVLPEKILVQKLIISSPTFEGEKVIHKDGSISLSLNEIFPGFASIIHVQGQVEIRQDFDWDPHQLELIDKIPKTFTVLCVELAAGFSQFGQLFKLVHKKLRHFTLEVIDPEIDQIDALFDNIGHLSDVELIITTTTEALFNQYSDYIKHLPKSSKHIDIDVLKISLGLHSLPQTKYYQTVYVTNILGATKTQKRTWDLIQV